MINKLKKKFILINMILIFIVLSVTFIAIYVSTDHRLVRESSDILNRLINQETVTVPKKEIGGPTPNKVVPPSSPIVTFAVQLDKNNKITKVFDENIDIVDTATLNSIISYCLKSKSETGIVANQDFRFLKQTNESGIKIAFADRSGEISTLKALIQTSILVGIGSLIAFFIISIFLASWALKPIQKSWEQQRQFVADASHELKTPLTVILANSDIVLSHKDDTISNQIKWINYIKTEAERMTTLVNDLLFLAKTDSNRNEVIFSEINFSDTVWNCVLPFESIAFEQEQIIDSDIAPDVFIRGDEGRLKQLIIILIDNAIKYCNEKGHINVTLEKTSDKVNLSVTNTGEPIPEEEIQHIFKRFYRVDKSRVREKGGYGLGLSIAKTIVDSHHGKINIKSSKYDGTTFTVSFPLQKNHCC